MGLISKKVTIRWNNSNKQHFKSKGYNFTKLHDYFEVNTNDLLEKSPYKVEVQCDYCNGEIYFMPYADYIEKMEGDIKKIACLNCLWEKRRETQKLGLTGKESLTEEYPSIAKMWHPSKNSSLSPLEVTSNSSIKYWWQCQLGHEFQSTTNNLIKKQGKCEKCHTLAFKFPELAKEWHPSKNGELTPWDVSYGSGKKVWWYSEECGHTWRDSIDHRTSKVHRGCTICGKGIQTSFPEQSLYFYFKKIFNKAESRFIHNSANQKVELDVFIPELKFAIEYDGIWHKNKKKQDEDKNAYCKKNNVKLLRIRCEDLPKLKKYDAVIIHHQGNERITKSYYKTFEKLIGEVGKYILNNYSELINEKQKNKIINLKEINLLKDRSEILALYKSELKEKSFVRTHPQIALEWDYEKNGDLKPENFTFGSTYEAHWKCLTNETHSWRASINQRTNSESQCPYCYGRYADKTNNLAILYPNLIKEVHPTKNNEFNPCTTKPGSEKVIWWLCPNNHSYEKAVYSRAINGTGCDYCNSLAFLKPEIAKEWHPTKNGELTPWDISVRSNKKIWWTCPIGHEDYPMTAHNRMNSACPECGKIKSIATRKKNNLERLKPLAETHQDLILLWHPTKNEELTPWDVVCSSNKRVWWLCENNHETFTSIVSRTKGHMCRKCYEQNKIDRKNQIINELIQWLSEEKITYSAVMKKYNIGSTAASKYLKEAKEKFKP